MTAIPVKTDKTDSAIAPLFGKAKWFALIEKTGDVIFWKNDLKSGREVVNRFVEIGVSRVIFQDMGGNPFMLLDRAGIACFHSGKGRVLFTDALAAMKAETLVKVSTENMFEYVEKSQKHSDGNHHHHDHDHEHEHEHEHQHEHHH
jgi:predicted Fe-Mo cluster-binding NifX family protein